MVAFTAEGSPFAFGVKITWYVEAPAAFKN
jgi:hypothetical protein